MKTKPLSTQKRFITFVTLKIIFHVLSFYENKILAQQICTYKILKDLLDAVEMDLQLKKHRAESPALCYVKCKYL